jgi:hypothetical protein
MQKYVGATCCLILLAINKIICQPLIPTIMLHYLTNSGIFDKPMLLAKKAIPTEVIADVFADYSLLDQRVMLWKLIHAVLTSENEEFSEPRDRDGLLYQCKRLEELLEAAWMISEDDKLAKKRLSGRGDNASR